jgi:hypothetical protein
MGPVFIALVALVGSTFQTRSAMQAEIAALRHQLAVLQRSAPRHRRRCLRLRLHSQSPLPQSKGFPIGSDDGGFELSRLHMRLDAKIENEVCTAENRY